MNLKDLEIRLGEIKNQVLASSMDVPVGLSTSISFEIPPDPDMGDRGLPCFKLAPHFKKSPVEIAQEVAEVFSQQSDNWIADVEAAGPYVNIFFDTEELGPIVLEKALQEGSQFGHFSIKHLDHVMVEFSSPNSNKPQHIGHLRNNILGDALASLLSCTTEKVSRINLVNDRGVHVCKSMMAYDTYGEGQEPDDVKGDHFVGQYYQQFHNSDDLELEDAQDMLNLWEEGQEDVVCLWEKMREWVLLGFDETYQRLGIQFDRVDFESETYVGGKQLVEKGLESGVFEKSDDEAVVFDLKHIGFDGGHKVVLRADGTSVYMTQDIGTFATRIEQEDPDRLIHVVGDEQERHFDILAGILGEMFPNHIQPEHFSYGMVDLPDGAMSSRKGEVVYADTFLDEMHELASKEVEARHSNLDQSEISRRAEILAQAALKFYMLDYSAGTKIKFDPEQSLDFQGRTGPYCLYSYARISSLLKKEGDPLTLSKDKQERALRSLGTDLEKQVLLQLQQWPSVLEGAAQNLNPSQVTGYLFELCSRFSTLYNDNGHRVTELEGDRKSGLLLMSQVVQQTLSIGLGILGISTLEQM